MRLGPDHHRRHGNVPGPFGVDQSPCAGGPIFSIMAQHHGRAGFQPKLDVVFQPQGTTDVTPRRQANNATALGRASVDRRLHRRSRGLFHHVDHLGGEAGGTPGTARGAKQVGYAFS